MRFIKLCSHICCDSCVPATLSMTVLSVSSHPNYPRQKCLMSVRVLSQLRRQCRDLRSRYSLWPSLRQDIPTSSRCGALGMFMRDGQPFRGCFDYIHIMFSFVRFYACIIPLFRRCGEGSLYCLIHFYTAPRLCWLVLAQSVQT